MENSSLGEGYLLSKICNHLNNWQQRMCDFWPESPDGVLSASSAGRGLPCAVVSAASGAVKLRQYVDGGYVGQFPFRVGIRIAGVTSADRLAVLDFFDNLTVYLEAFVPAPDSMREYIRCRLTALPTKDSTGKDGTEEYHAFYTMEYCQHGA